VDGWIAACVVAALSTFLWPIYSARMIPSEDVMLMTAGSCYGDLPIHIAIANTFLVGVNQEINWPARRSDGSLGMMSPIFAGEPLTYPFLPDFHAAIFVRLGDSMRNGFLHPGFTLICALWALIFFFAVRVVRSRVGAVLAVLLTLGAGGMAGIRWFLEGGWAAVASNDVVQHDPSGEWKQLWFAFVPHVMLPQRGANFAYPMAMVALLLVWIATDHTSAWAVPVAGAAHVQPSAPPSGDGGRHKGAAALPAAAGAPSLAAPSPSVRPTSPFGSAMSIADRRRMLIMAAAVAGSLPLHQAHAFVAVGIIIGTVALLDAHKWLRDMRLLAAWVEAGIVAVALGLPQINLFTKTAKEGFGGKFTEAGWLYKNYDFGSPHGVVGFYRFWWHSVGPLFHLHSLALLLLLGECVWGYWLGARLEKDGGGNAVSRFAAHFRDRSGMGVASEVAIATACATGVAAAEGALAHGGVVAGAALPDPELSERNASHGASERRGAGSGEAPLPQSVTADPPGVIERLACALLDRPNLAGPLPGLSAVLLLDRIDALLDGRCNALSANHRAWDGFKLLLGALLVFLLGNYVRMQPWDRDNAKIFYPWVFVAASFAGGILALPIELLLGQASGFQALERLASALWGQGAGASMRGSTAHLKKDDNLSAAGSLGAGRGAAPAGPGDARAAGGVGAGAAKPARMLLGIVGTLGAVAFLVLCTFSGLAMVYQEYRMGNSALFDRDSVAVGAFFREHVHPRAVTMHSNHHTQPSCSLAGRPSLVSYYGWVSNHGYNAGPRLQDRDYAMANLLKDEDSHAYNILRRWGVRYVVGEWLPKHPRGAGSGQDADLYLDRQVRRIYRAGRFEVFEVLGY
jgi:hypothetical protein